MKRSVLDVMAWGFLFLAQTTALGAQARDFLKKPDGWFSTAEAERAASNILSWQSEAGGWPKNTSTVDAPYTGERSKLSPTFDNGATTDELRLLARRYQAVPIKEYADAFGRGLTYILNAQYPTGGWPQSHPPGRHYHRHITFNDDAMVRLMKFLREVATTDRYGFLTPARRQSAQEAFDRGIECILRCQIKVDGTLTAWCAQHDELDYRPRPARSFELVSISGAESVDVVRLLMSIEDPTPEVVRSIEAAVAWFETAALHGIRLETRETEGVPGGRDRVVVSDPDAPRMWARFYEIGTKRPIYCDRDGVATYALAEIGHERRNGYRWLGTWPQRLLETEYPAWKAHRAD